MLLLIFLGNVLLPQQTSPGLRKQPQGYLQEAEALEQAGGVFCNTAHSAGSWGCSEGAAAKREPELQSRCCCGNAGAFSSERGPRNKGWNPPCQLVATQDRSDRGEPGSKSTEAVTTPKPQGLSDTWQEHLSTARGAQEPEPEGNCLLVQAFLFSTVSPSSSLPSALPATKLPTCSRQHCG